jgi:hypothetical protein
VSAKALASNSVHKPNRRMSAKQEATIRTKGVALERRGSADFELPLAQTYRTPRFESETVVRIERPSYLSLVLIVKPNMAGTAPPRIISSGQGFLKRRESREPIDEQTRSLFPLGIGNQRQSPLPSTSDEPVDRVAAETLSLRNSKSESGFNERHRPPQKPFRACVLADERLDTLL